MPHVDIPQSRCRAAVARGDITPPVGIYHRMWGAATHERSTGVHKPLLATAAWFGPTDGGDPQLLKRGKVGGPLDLSDQFRSIHRAGVHKQKGAGS